MFNIQKWPLAVTNQNFSSNAEGQHCSFGSQFNSEKAQNHSEPSSWGGSCLGSQMIGCRL